MKKLIFLILLFSGFIASKADDTGWKIHPTFNEEVNHVIETPDQVYFTSRTITKNPQHETFFSLFRYDKRGEELMPLSASNILNGNTIRDVMYNGDKGYLAILYKNYDIDFLYNDGKVVNIPYYKQANLSASKDVNSISIDPGHDRIYFATEFGYIAINDKKGEIAESRIYGEPLDAFCRMGDIYLLSVDKKLIKAGVDSPRLSLNEYEFVADLDYPAVLYPLSDRECLLIEGNTNYKFVKKIALTGEDLIIEKLFEGEVINIDYNSKGVNIAMDKTLYQVNTDGSYTSLPRPENYQDMAAASENMSEVWNGFKRKGLSSIKKTGENWSVTRDWMLPNAPAPYASFSFLNHPDYGFLVLDYGYNPPTSQLWNDTPFQLSSYKNGRWTNHAPVFTYPDRTLMMGPNGMVMDPENNSYLYISSYHNGFSRINLKDPQDIIHLSRANDPDANKEGFVVLSPVPVANPGFSNISAPCFDKQGNLWMSYADWDDTATPNPHFYCWLAADRKVTGSAQDIRMPKSVEFDVEMPVSNLASSLPLLKSGNGLIVYSNGVYNESLVLLDTNGTPVDMKDDKTYPFPYFVDSDGNPVELQYVKYIWEDPSTGYVWLCHGNGVCYFVPSQVLQGNYQLYRVKVSRNDGTNLADYLLEGVAVNHVATDGEGRKWFSTAGAGIVCTSSDGREIIEEFNTSNSPLPDDMVYSIGYNSASNTLMISTGQGLAEYSLPVSQSSSTKEDIKAYPNPVRPNYSGYVTITDIPTGSFVKIVDAGGNLVKELGIVSGFDILWDISDSNFNRVKSGVYYIMVSPSDETSSYSTVGKILVMS